MKAFIKAASGAVWSGVKAFMGGGSTYLYIAAGVAVLGMWGYINHLEHKVDDLKTDLATCEAIDGSKTALIDSQERTKIRDDKKSKELQNAEDEIINSDSPIDAAYERLRQQREARRANNPDE